MKSTILIALALASCTKRNPDACCETADECFRLGTSQPVFCVTGACVNFTCVDGNVCDDPGDCPSDERCAAGTCTSVDAGPMVPAFDIAYADVLRDSLANEALGLCLVIINTGSVPLDMSSLTLRAIADDHPTANVRLTLQTGGLIPPGQAGGLMGTDGEALIFGSGLVAEARTSPSRTYAAFTIEDAPVGTYDIKTDATLELDGVTFHAMFTTHVVDSPMTYLQPEHAVREHEFR